MWVLFWIVAAILALLGALLLLPVYLVVKTDEKGQPQLYFRVLGKTLEGEQKKEKPKKTAQQPVKKTQNAPQNPVADMLKKALGIHRFEKEYLQKKIQSGGFADTVSQSLEMIRALVDQVIDVIRGCVAVRFQLKLRCGGTDPADVAMAYSRYCALVYPLTGYLGAVIRLRPGKTQVDIRCDMLAEKTEFFCHVVIRLRIFYVVRCVLRILQAEAKRKKEEMKETTRKA